MEVSDHLGNISDSGTQYLHASEQFESFEREVVVGT